MKKRCKNCKIPKRLTEFYKNNRSPDGRVNVCKACKNERAEERRTGSVDISDLLRRWLPVACVVLMMGCASVGQPAVYLDTKIVWQNDEGSDWMVRPEREWIDETNNPRFHAHLGLAWQHNVDCPYIATGTDALKWLHIGCSKGWGSKENRPFFEYAVIHQVDSQSDWYLSTDRKDWQGHNPFNHFRLGWRWKHKIRCPVIATGRSMFQGAPFESEDDAPDLYWSHLECTKRWGGQ